MLTNTTYTQIIPPNGYRFNERYDLWPFEFDKEWHILEYINPNGKVVCWCFYIDYKMY